MEPVLVQVTFWAEPTVQTSPLFGAVTVKPALILKSASEASLTSLRKSTSETLTLAVAVGVFGRKGRRNSPPLINRGYGRSFFWDSRISTLEQQVLQPIEDPNEMDLPLSEAAARVGLPPDDISRALASFVRSILSGNSTFDRYINGDRAALSPEQEAGLQLFRGKANCVACHVGPNFTDERLHNTGIAWRDGEFTDIGAGQGNFKTPTLREVARTAPYMHDGSLATLEDVIEYYDRGGNRNPSLDPEIRPLRLSATEKQSLIAFLHSLNGTTSEGSKGDDQQRVFAKP